MNPLNSILGLFKVKGDSMLPRLAAGDFVLTSRLFFRINEGDLVVIEHPHYGRLIKRVLKVEDNHRMWLCGENDSSLPPEKMGWIVMGQLSGKVLFCIRQPNADPGKKHFPA